MPSFLNLKFLNDVSHGLFYDWLLYLSPFRRDGGVNRAENEDKLVIQIITTGYVKHPLALPGSAKKNLTKCSFRDPSLSRKKGFRSSIKSVPCRSNP